MTESGTQEIVVEAPAVIFDEAKGAVKAASVAGSKREILKEYSPELAATAETIRA